MADIVMAVSGQIAGYVVDPIRKQLGYVFCFNANVKNLKDEAEKLNDVKARIQIHVNAALRNVELIDPVVQKWLLDADKSGDDAQTIIQKKSKFPKGCFNRWCLNLKQRYVLSRYAKKKREYIIRLRQDGKFEMISFPAPLIPVVASTSTTRIFGTRESILDEIIKNLKDEEISMIGICGMGGVGKTTMAEQVLKRVTEEKLFDECAMAVIGQKKDLAKVQIDIAEMLGLEIYEQNPIAREAKLHRRLENRKVLIILDDVWEEFELKVLGVNFQSLQFGCKVVFTSREQGLWRKLKMKVDIPLVVLTDDEAWGLFHEMVGNSLQDKLQLQQVAKEIVKECGGLPLSLVTLGGALLGKSTHLWKDTLRQLKTDYPSKIQGVAAKVHQSLEMSYNFLEDDDAKLLFLLCCLFEEDFDIHVEDLIRMGLGLRLFRGIYGLQQARDRVFALLEQLKSRFLLLPGKTEYDYLAESVNPDAYIRMHDVVRNAAKTIAAVEKVALVVDNDVRVTMWQKQDTLKDLSWISVISKKIREFPAELKSPRIKLLRCRNTVLQTTGYEGMEELQVLDIHGVIESPQLPSSFQFPSSLRTLYFRECNFEKITSIGDLPNLESLSFVKSDMEVLPIGKGHLSNLVSLDLTMCYGLRTIQPGVISGLCQLQELYMKDIQLDWEGGEIREGRNASVKEFELLSNLHTLHINFKDPSVLPKSPLFSKLKKYAIQIGVWDPPHYSYNYDKCCAISLHTSVPLKGDIIFLSETAEELLLEGEFSKGLVHELVKDGSPSLKFLELSFIDTLRYIANAKAPVLLSSVESLSLSYLSDLQKMSCRPLMVGSFQKLKNLNVNNCRKLKNVFQLSIAAELMQLQSVSICDCESMEEVICKERAEVPTNNLVSSLHSLTLSNLPNLDSFSRGINEIEFPQLKLLSLQKLPQIECLFSRLSDQSIFPLKKKVSFPSLETMILIDLDNMRELWYSGQLQSGSFRNLSQLSVSHCHKLRNVFTPFITRQLVHLRNLLVSDCSLLEVIVSGEEEEEEEKVIGASTTLLPALLQVDLCELPVLERFCHVAHDLEFTMLDYIRVIKCPKLKTFSPGCVSTPKLDNVTLSVDEMGPTIWVDNLNSTIAHRYKHVTSAAAAAAAKTSSPGRKR